MRKLFVSLIVLGLVSLPGVAVSQPTEVGVSVAQEALPFTPKPWQPPSLVWGQGPASAPACEIGTHGFVARLAEDGTELWRREGSLDPGSLFAGLTSFDPRHVLASTVQGVAADPLTDELYAVTEALVGWEGGDCQAGVTTARGTLVLGLTPEGLPVRDAYFGTMPEGPPPTDLACHQLCAADRLPQMIGREISVGADGEVMIAGHLREVGRDEVFAVRLDSNLSPREGGRLSFPYSEEEAPGKVMPGVVIPLPVCPPLPDPSKNIVSLVPVNDPDCDDCLDKENLYVFDDGCEVFVPAGDGVEAKFKVAPGTVDLKIDLYLTCTTSPSQCHATFYLKEVGGGWIKIASRDGINGVIDTDVDPVVVVDGSPYINANDRVRLQVIIGIGFFSDSDTDLDLLDCCEQ